MLVGLTNSIRLMWSTASEPGFSAHSKDCKLPTHRCFIECLNQAFSETGKVVEELLHFKCLYLLTLELKWANIISRCFDL